MHIQVVVYGLSCIFHLGLSRKIGKGGSPCPSSPKVRWGFTHPPLPPSSEKVLGKVGFRCGIGWVGRVENVGEDVVSRS
jgi:hypothetical protein